MALIHWLRLTMTGGLGPVLIGRLVEAAGGAEAACAAGLPMLRLIEGIGSPTATKIFSGLKQTERDAPPELDRALKMGLRLICLEDADYPAMLRSIPDPPCVLYVKGAFEPRDLNALAIVGSRRCSLYGREQATRFAALLAGSGFTIVSGGARGVDTAAHRGALSHPAGRTLAICGSGLDQPYPPENAELFEQIAARGAVISEYPLGTAPLAENFPRRNRIVSGLSRGVLVVEADIRSGALITARQAIEDHNRNVFAVPGRVDQPMSAGPHKLIREGATLAAGIEDILDNLGPFPDDVRIEPSLFDIAPEAMGAAAGATATGATAAASSPQPSLHGLSDRQKRLLECIENEPVSVDALVDRTDLPASVILGELTFLSLKGLVRRTDGQTYVRAGRIGG